MEYTKTEWNLNADPPINADNLNNIEEGISKCAEHINELLNLYDNETERIVANLLTGTVIWENENPNEDFVAQTITPTNSDGYINLEHYKRFVITVKRKKNEDVYYEYTVSNKGISYILSVGQFSNGDMVASRSVIINERSIRFANATNGYTYYAIPIKIVAYTW